MVPVLNLALQTVDQASAESLSADFARYLMASGGQLIDMRSPVEFDRDPLPGAVNLPVDAIAYGYTRLNRRRPIILCAANGIHCYRAAQMLANEGFSRIYQLTLH